MRLRRRRALNPRFARAICHSLSSAGVRDCRIAVLRPLSRPSETGLITRLVLVRQELLDLLLLRLFDQLVAEEVALVGLLVLEVALGGHLEALFGARVRLHLRHVRWSFVAFTLREA